MFDNFNPLYFGITIGILILAIGVHEFCHAKFADMAGDPTPRMQGRVTLNLFNHLDPIGSICFLLSSIAGVGIGWGRPVMVDPRKMRNPRWDHFISVAAGPLSNLTQAVLFAFVLRMMVSAGQFSTTTVFEVMGRETQNPLAIFLVLGVLYNVSLFCFNLIPLGPLDGHWLVGAFLPESSRYAWYKFNRGIGMLIFLFLVLMPAGSPLDLLGNYYAPLMIKIFFFLTGIRVG